MSHVTQLRLRSRWSMRCDSLGMLLPPPWIVPSPATRGATTQKRPQTRMGHAGRCAPPCRARARAAPRSHTFARENDQPRSVRLRDRRIDGGLLLLLVEQALPERQRRRAQDVVAERAREEDQRPQRQQAAERAAEKATLLGRDGAKAQPRLGVRYHALAQRRQKAALVAQKVGAAGLTQANHVPAARGVAAKGARVMAHADDGEPTKRRRAVAVVSIVPGTPKDVRNHEHEELRLRIEQ
eukprot:6579887-Prymnesium_polylepis.1